MKILMTYSDLALYLPFNSTILYVTFTQKQREEKKQMQGKMTKITSILYCTYDCATHVFLSPSNGSSGAENNKWLGVHTTAGIFFIPYWTVSIPLRANRSRSQQILQN